MVDCLHGALVPMLGNQSIVFTKIVCRLPALSWPDTFQQWFDPSSRSIELVIVKPMAGNGPPVMSAAQSVCFVSCCGFCFSLSMVFGSWVVLLIGSGIEIAKGTQRTVLAGSHYDVV